MTTIVFAEIVLVIVRKAGGVKRVIVIIESLRHFSIFTFVNVERKVLIELESVKRNHLKLGKNGVDKAWRLQWLATLFPITGPGARCAGARENADGEHAERAGSGPAARFPVWGSDLLCGTSGGVPVRV